jgi:hypothetical protein
MPEPVNDRNYDSDIIKCKFCGKEITFRREICGKNGRPIPLDLDITGHICVGRTSKEEYMSKQDSIKRYQVTENHENKTANKSPISNRESVYERMIGNIEHSNALQEHFLMESNQISKQLEINNILIKKILEYFSSSDYKNYESKIP